jgi:hypothetical protein
VGQVGLLTSFLDDERKLSFYDVVFPLVKLRANRTPEYLLGTCFPLGSGLYATAAHIFDAFMNVRDRYKGLDRRPDPLTVEEKTERQKDMQENHLFESLDVNCGALVLDQAELRKGNYKALGFSLVYHVLLFLDDDFA